MAEGISETELSNAIQLYPNPATATITIQSESVVITKVEILDMAGRIVMTETNSTINIHVLETGVYFARVTTESGMTTLRFVKQ